MSQLFHTPKVVRINSAGTPFASAKANFYLTTTTTRTDTYTDSARGTPHANPVVADAAGQFAPIYLDPAITYRCIITESDDTEIDDVDPIGTPLTAADILVVDAGGHFAGSEAETVLTDIGANYGKKTATGTWTADQTYSSAALLMADNIIERPEIKDYSITHSVISSSSGTLTIDLSTGNSFVTTLTENVTNVTISNPSPTGKYCQFTIKIIQDGSAGAFTVDWQTPETVLFPGGADIVITTANDAIDVVTLWTIDAGTTWYATFAQAYA